MSLTSYRAAPPRGRVFLPLLGAAYCLHVYREEGFHVFSGPGDDLLSQVLRHSTIGAEAFDGRVRDGIGSDRFAEGHQAGETHCRSKWGFYSIASLFCACALSENRFGFSGACEVMGVDK